MLEFIENYLNIETLEKNEKFMKDSEEKLLNNYEGFLGWVNPKRPSLEVERLKEVSKNIKNRFDTVLVCAIGGSFLGSKSAIDAIYGPLFNLKLNPKIIYIGTSLSSSYIAKMLEILENANSCLVVVSKSGTTIETTVNYKIFKDFFKNKYSDYKERIFFVTGEGEGFLKKEAFDEGFEIFSIPGNIGGRYSVFTNAGLLPMAISGIDIDKLLKGAEEFYNYLKDLDYKENPCLKYALCRNLMYRENKNIEILCTYDSKFEFFLKWYVQLFGESEGKSQNVVYPSYLTYTQDLHSMGQFLQEGPKNIFETIIDVTSNEEDILVSLNEKEDENFSLNKLNKFAMKATKLAHKKNDIESFTVQIDKVDEHNMGQLYYFFMYSCAISSCMFEVNPFNQPGVEKYKEILKRLVIENKRM